MRSYDIKQMVRYNTSISANLCYYRCDNYQNRKKKKKKEIILIFYFVNVNQTKLPVQRIVYRMVYFAFYMHLKSVGFKEALRPREGRRYLLPSLGPTKAYTYLFAVIVPV